jgi:hypothetical protein
MFAPRRLSVVGALALVAVGASLGETSCLRSSTNCPSQLPLTGSCHDPDQWLCDYRLPCGEKATCMCISDDNGGYWSCNGDVPDGGSTSAPKLDDTYSCSSCPSAQSGVACIEASSKLLTPPP